jgi:hypothetical protein
MLSTMVATMLMPIVHSMIGNQSTAVRGPPPALWRITTMYPGMMTIVASSVAQVLRSA